MQLMEDEKEDFNIDQAAQNAIEELLIPATAKKILEQVTKSREVKDESKSIIVSLVKRQREMEVTFRIKMDREFKEKTDFVTLVINTMMKDIENRVIDLSNTIDKQIDILDLCQARIIETNNKLYKQSGNLKTDIFNLQVEINSVDDQLQEIRENQAAQNRHSPGIEPATTTHSSGAKRNTAAAIPTFMANHPIDINGGQNSTM